MLGWGLIELEKDVRQEEAIKISKTYTNGFGECMYYLPIKPVGAMKALIIESQLFTNDKPFIDLEENLVT